MLFTLDTTLPTARLRLKKSETGRGRPRANQVTLLQISLSHKRGIRYFIGKYGPRKNEFAARTIIVCYTEAEPFGVTGVGIRCVANSG